MMKSVLLKKGSYLLSIVIALSLCVIPTHGKEKTKPLHTFKGLTLQPASGKKPDSIVVLLHGYGDMGENFLLLGTLWANTLPNTLFVAPDAPRSCKNNASGKQWLSLEKNSKKSQILEELKSLTTSLNRYLDDLLKTHDLPPEKLALVGFSQGARVALYVGLHRKCAGVVACSGAYVNPPQKELAYHPPVLFIHGTTDNKVSSDSARSTQKFLESHNVPATLYLLPNVGHEINPQGVTIGGEFLNECLYNPGSIQKSEKQ